VFSALLLVGVLIALQYRYALILLLVLIPIQIARARQEAKVLEVRFGEEYRNYRKGTWF
jgi:protein-S-isoprenylcysteine O-methyltransferase Ste14